MKFTCPKCSAVNETTTAGSGCGACGYGKSVQTSETAVTKPMCSQCHQLVEQCQGRHVLLG
jgi:hypothetical protein